ncbi:globin [Tribolium castaneum]
MSTLFEISIKIVAIMGIITSTLSYYMTKTNDPDPITGLTSRDRYVIQTSWAPVKKDLTGNGVALLLLYFEKFPATKNYFVFKDVPNEKLKTDKKFHAHCNSVMVTLDSLIANLNDGELIVSLLEKLGKNHKRHGIKDDAYDQLKETVIELFSSFMTKEELETWDKLLKVAFSVIIKYL